MEEWDYEKNSELGLTPENVSYSSGKKVNWKLPYDDIKTGKHFDFEWHAIVSGRTNNGLSCPYLSGKAVYQGFNDLASVKPELVKEWHSTKNSTLKPTNITFGSGKKVWWQCPVCGHEWQAIICNRSKGRGCPNCSQAGTSIPELALYFYISKSFSDTLYRHQIQNIEFDIFIPSLKLAIEYDGSYYHQNKIEKENKKDEFCKNNGIRLIRLRSNKLQQTESAETIWVNEGNYNKISQSIIDLFNYLNLEYNFEINIDKDYSKLIETKALKIKQNSLAIKFPEIAAQWHPTKNGKLTPDNFTYGSDVKVWWYLSYDDPKTGKHFDFEWQAPISRRVQGNGCPYLSNQAVWSGFNDLKTKNPELAAEWHSTKNGNLKPENISAFSGKKVWWLLPYDDPITGKHFDFEWQASISSRTNGNNCPYLSSEAIWVGFNDLATNNPELAAQWHPTKNGNLKPEQFGCNSEKKVWWLLPYDDPITGKHFDFEWQARIDNRHNGKGCPFLSGKAIWVGFNDLATVNPELAAQWHPTKNGDLKPTDVTAGSGQKVWWLLPYDDPITKKHFDFEWKAPVARRHNGRGGCPYLSGKSTYQGFNDFKSRNPILATEWNYTKNKNLTPDNITYSSGKKIWWQCSTCNHEWQATISNRVKNCKCPQCKKNLLVK